MYSDYFSEDLLKRLEITSEEVDEFEAPTDEDTPVMQTVSFAEFFGGFAGQQDRDANYFSKVSFKEPVANQKQSFTNPSAVDWCVFAPQSHKCFEVIVAPDILHGPQRCIINDLLNSSSNQRHMQGTTVRFHVPLASLEALGCASAVMDNEIVEALTSVQQWLKRNHPAFRLLQIPSSVNLIKSMSSFSILPIVASLFDAQNMAGYFQECVAAFTSRGINDVVVLTNDVFVNKQSCPFGYTVWDTNQLEYTIQLLSKVESKPKIRKYQNKV